MVTFISLDSPSLTNQPAKTGRSKRRLVRPIHQVVDLQSIETPESFASMDPGLYNRFGLVQTQARQPGRFFQIWV